MTPQTRYVPVFLRAAFAGALGCALTFPLAAPVAAQDAPLPAFTVKPIRLEVRDKNDFGTNIENDEIVVFGVAALASEVVVDVGDFIPGAGEFPTGITAPGVRVKAYGDGTGEEDDFLELSDLEHLSLTTGESSAIAGLPLWGFAAEPQAVQNPAELMFMFFVVEKDDGFPFTSIPGAVTGVVTGELVQTGRPLDERFARARQRVGETLESLVQGWPSDDDVIGPVNTMTVTADDFDDTGRVVRDLHFKSEEKSAHYVLKVRMVREASLRMGDGGTPQSGHFDFIVHDPDDRSRCAGSAQVCRVEIWADGVIAGSIPVQNARATGSVPVGPFGAQSIVASLRDGDRVLAQIRANYPVELGPITGGIYEPEKTANILAGVGTDFAALFTQNLAPLPCDRMLWRREEAPDAALSPGVDAQSQGRGALSGRRAVAVPVERGTGGARPTAGAVTALDDISATATLNTETGPLERINPKGCSATFRFPQPGHYRVVVAVDGDAGTVESSRLVSVSAPPVGAVVPDLTKPRSGIAVDLGTALPVEGTMLADAAPPVIRLEMRLQSRPGDGWTEVPVQVSSTAGNRVRISGVMDTGALGLRAGSYDLRFVTGTAEGVSARETTRLTLVEPPR